MHNLPIAGGAYFIAQNGAMLFASKHLYKSAGVVASILGGPSKPAEQTHTSRRPKALRVSSIKARVSCSEAMSRG